MQIVRTETLAQRTGAYYVRIQAMALRHQITPEQEFDEHDTPQTRYIVIYDGVLPVATGRLYAIDAERVMLGRIVVLEEYRGRGLGRTVVTESERWAAELGFRTAVLEARTEKQGFYEKLGYTADPARIICGETFTCIHMEKPLISLPQSQCCRC